MSNMSQTLNPQQVLSKLTVNYNRVHSKQCMDEADVVEHIVGLTSSLATYKFRLVFIIFSPTIFSSVQNIVKYYGLQPAL